MGTNIGRRRNSAACRGCPAPAIRAIREIRTGTAILYALRQAPQRRLLAKVSGIGLIFFSGVAFALDGWRDGSGPPMLNGKVLGGVLISLSAFFAARKLDSTVALRFAKAQRIVAVKLFIWAALWWLGSGWAEIADRAIRDRQSTLFLLFLAVSAGAAALLARSLQWEIARGAAMVYLPALLLLMPGYLEEHEHLPLGLRWLAWPLTWVVQLFVLRLMDEHDEPLAHAWPFVSVLLLTALLAWEAARWTGLIASGAWAAAAASAMASVMALLVWRFRNRPPWPVPMHPLSYLAASVALVTGQVVYLAALSIAQPGNPDPWPYIPMLNPFDLGMLFAMLCVWLSLAALRRDSTVAVNQYLAPWVLPYRLLSAALLFVMTTFALVRGVHHYTAVPWEMHTLFRSDTVHAALSI